MKLQKKLLLILFGALLLVNTSNAESPREQFTQMVEQLQNSPDDNNLREQIIKLAQELNPAPALPEEAERRMARGKAATEHAKSVEDYQDAVEEFKLATLAAPWHGDAYFNLGVTQSKAEDYASAIRNLKLAQLAYPEDKEIKTFMYKLEYLAEQKVREDRDKANEAYEKRQEKEKLSLIVPDERRGLMWQKKNDDLLRTFKDAISYCNGLTLAGYSDWQLPSIEELKTIINVSTIFGNIEGTYWSSTTDADCAYCAWIVYFGHGRDNAGPGAYKTNNNYVRCVRAGQ
jgi:tetratricopeptide (TPR) repeat protein